VTTTRRTTITRILAFLFVVGITLVLFSLRHEIHKFRAYGYPGIFLISLLSSATVFVPIPAVLITSAMGAIFNPFWIAMASGLGAGLGEFTGYLAGYSGQAVIERRGWYAQVEIWMKKYGDVIILVLAFIPNPLFDMAGITSGALKLPWYRFLSWTLAGKILKMLVFAYGGFTVLKWFPFK
jgi:membrane protein YqaA with SNARE-associated domain